MPESTNQHLEARVEELSRRLARTQEILADLLEELLPARAPKAQAPDLHLDSR